MQDAPRQSCAAMQALSLPILPRFGSIKDADATSVLMTASMGSRRCMVSAALYTVRHASCRMGMDADAYADTGFLACILCHAA
jgi:hypothetical protein